MDEWLQAKLHLKKTIPSFSPFSSSSNLYPVKLQYSKMVVGGGLSNMMEGAELWRNVQ